jgi:hypothetical protein
MSERRTLLVILTTWGWITCSEPQGPNTVFGSYQLTGYIRGGTDLPLPYMQVGSTPADTDKWVAGTLTLSSDSSWTNVWQIVHCQSGICGAPQSESQYGTFSHFAERDSAGAIAIVFVTLPSYLMQNAAVVRGHRLELNASWAYER